MPFPSEAEANSILADKRSGQAVMDDYLEGEADALGFIDTASEDDAPDASSQNDAAPLVAVPTREGIAGPAAAPTSAAMDLSKNSQAVAAAPTDVAVRVAPAVAAPNRGDTEMVSLEAATAALGTSDSARAPAAAPAAPHSPVRPTSSKPPGGTPVKANQGVDGEVRVKRGAKDEEDEERHFLEHVVDRLKVNPHLAGTLSVLWTTHNAEYVAAKRSLEPLGSGKSAALSLIRAIAAIAPKGAVLRAYRDETAWKPNVKKQK